MAISGYDDERWMHRSHVGLVTLVGKTVTTTFKRLTREVPGAGIEPALHTEGDFKSPVPTSYTTRAGSREGSRGRSDAHGSAEGGLIPNAEDVRIRPCRANRRWRSSAEDSSRA